MLANLEAPNAPKVISTFEEQSVMNIQESPPEPPTLCPRVHVFKTDS